MEQLFQQPQQPFMQPFGQPIELEIGIEELIENLEDYVDQAKDEEDRVDRILERYKVIGRYIRQQTALPLDQQDPIVKPILSVVNAVDKSRPMTQEERRLRKKRAGYVGPSLRQDVAQEIIAKDQDNFMFESAAGPEFILSEHPDVLQKKIENAFIGIYAEYGHALAHFDTYDCWVVSDPAQLPITPATLVVDADFYYTKAYTAVRPQELMIVSQVEPNDLAVAFIRFIDNGCWPEPIRKIQRREARLEVNLCIEDLTCRCSQIFPQVRKIWLQYSDTMKRINSIKDFIV